MKTSIKTAVWTIGFILAASFLAPAFAGDGALWKRYKQTFITADGRTVDYYQGQVSHSEGQGYAMLFSAWQNDQETFDTVWGWTKNNLRVRADNLFAWQWGKRTNGRWDVVDYNNATDGDMLIAYALLKAADRWGGPGYRVEAVKIIADIRKKLTVNWHGKAVILPSYYGFVRDGSYIINPSYLVFPALRAFASVDDRSFWENVYRDSLFFAVDNCFGRLCLPADWIVLGGAPAVFSEKSRLYGAESVRTVLYLTLADEHRLPKGVGWLLEYYEKNGYMPLWADLENDSVSLQDAPAGYYAIYGMAAMKAGKEAVGKRLLKAAGDKLAVEKDNYYSFSLYLLALSAEGS